MAGKTHKALKQAIQKQADSHPATHFDAGQAVKRVTRSKQTPEESLWTFSWRYWSQIEYFGLEGTGIDNQWLVSVLERLKQLSADTIERVYRDSSMRSAMRFHPINWQAHNIPIAKTDIPSIPNHYANNPEFELHQFQISMGKGRVVGFFDENWVFNIVLLDPLHNLQPSSRHNYAVDPCHPLSCEITSLREGIRECITRCENEECPTAQQVTNLIDGHEKHYEQFEILMIKVKDSGQLVWAKELVNKGRAESLTEIFEAGLLSFIE